MRRLLISSIVLFAALVTPLAAQRKGAAAARGPVTFAISVTDPSGAPVPDVKVSVTGAATRTSRTEGGRIAFEGLPAGAYRMRFEQAGFVTFEREVTGRGGSRSTSRSRCTRCRVRRRRRLPVVLPLPPRAAWTRSSSSSTCPRSSRRTTSARPPGS